LSPDPPGADARSTACRPTARTYVIKSNGEGTSSRVALQFTETATGQRVDFLTEFGKTKIS